MKSLSRRTNKHGHFVTTYIDDSGKKLGKVFHRTSESYGGYTMSFKDVRGNGTKSVRGVAIRPPSTQIVRYAQTKDKAMRLLKQAIDG